MVNEFKLLDAWQAKHPNSKDFMYYSNRHVSWSRIDMYWISTGMMREVMEMEILPSTYTDHRPLLLTLRDYSKMRNWQFNMWDLRDEAFVKDIKKELEEFFKWNFSEETADGVVWDASKALFRGLALRQSIYLFI